MPKLHYLVWTLNFLTPRSQLQCLQWRGFSTVFVSLTHRHGKPQADWHWDALNLPLNSILYQFRTTRTLSNSLLRSLFLSSIWKQKENRFPCLLISVLNWGLFENRDIFTYHIFLITVWTEITWYNCSILK